MEQSRTGSKLKDHATGVKQGTGMGSLPRLGNSLSGAFTLLRQVNLRSCNLLLVPAVFLIGPRIFLVGDYIVPYISETLYHIVACQLGVVSIKPLWLQAARRHGPLTGNPLTLQDI